MSLDISLIIKREEPVFTCVKCGHVHTKTERVEVYENNITHNLAKMADYAGIYKAIWRPREIKAVNASDIIQLLRDGLDDLKKRPEYFKAFEPGNGWGDYDVFVAFVEEYLNACTEYPTAIIGVDR